MLFRTLSKALAHPRVRIAPAVAVRRIATGTSGPKRTPLRRQIKRVLLGAAAAATVATAVAVYQYRHPKPQKPHDPTKKTLVVLGTGWAATSLIQELDTEVYNVVVVSPRNYFLFTPLLPSCTVGTIELRSIMQPLRFLTRFKSREVLMIEAECTDIDPFNKTIAIEDKSEVRGTTSSSKLSYDYLVVAVGSETSTFNIPGVREHACFLKEVSDAHSIRQRLIDCLETASFPGQSEAEMERLLHMVVVGGGPSGIEYAAELHDFLQEDIAMWYPQLASKLKITLVEALPKVLSSFNKELVDYTEREFAANKVELLTNTAVREVQANKVVVRDSKSKREFDIPYGLLVWAAGNAPRPLTRALIGKLDPAVQKQRRGLAVDDHLAVLGCEGIWAIGDNSATKYAPTAQVAAQQGKYLADVFEQLAHLEGDAASLVTSNAPEKTPAAPSAPTGSLGAAAPVATGLYTRISNWWSGANAQVAATAALPVPAVPAAAPQQTYKSWMAGWWLGRDAAARKPRGTATAMTKPTFAEPAWRTRVSPFKYDHFGSLAYIGNDVAIADLSDAYGGIKTGGKLTYYFWRSAYLSNLVSLRNKVSVLSDWTKKALVGRDIGRE